ncbi:DAK2 domain-containing protein [Schinkia azotoformans]|uniref:DAK2 domain-containing protein n=1 Tax=Schinkia azotoformans TaxID=1454 RepID=UPI002DB6EC2B|nr:DAK2 domain-containing protein [Schinkia azotoformans]MEC1721822.1 DAK2 domain-containing protein [Schinkia azotoformans]MED4411576.1 DAK2 domain-containing protein [Schinkia azotoformans]
MTMQQLDGIKFAGMVLAGANNLSKNAKMVDALNVFPVPDGDTGTNMNLSITSGANEVKQQTMNHVGRVASAFSKGLLMGARGNSGVILSQLFRGFAKSIETKETINSFEFAAAFEAGVLTAYKAVMKPVEGTILTVAKDASKKAIQVAKKNNDIVQVMEEVLKEAKASLDRTPDLLPVLKEVGVVDSGGQGLVTIYEGFLAVLKGEELPEVSEAQPSMTELVNAEHHKSVQSHLLTEDIEFGYCTEFMVKFEEDKLKNNPFSEDDFRQTLSHYGDSLLVVSDEEIVKVHIHAEHPGNVLNYAQNFGGLIKIKIENMREQHSSILEADQHVTTSENKAPQKKSEYGIVAVAMGRGIAELLKSLGAQAVIEGGQTMNPSTEDIVQAINNVHAEKVIVLPNNKNIIMAATQAATVVNQEVIVIPSKTVPQGMTSLLAFNPAVTASENEKAMTNALDKVKTGQITYAVRDTVIDGLEIKKDHFMGILDGKIVVTDQDKNKAAIALLENMISEDDEIITILQGEDANDSDLSELDQFLEENFPDIEVETHNGEQPLYPFIFAVE